MKGTKTLEIRLEGYGDFFGTRQGTLLIRDKNKNEKTFPLFESEIGTIILKTGNVVSTGALSTCGFFGINVLISVGTASSFLGSSGNSVRAASPGRIITSGTRIAYQNPAPRYDIEASSEDRAASGR